jgi:hypothetical protein
MAFYSLQTVRYVLAFTVSYHSHVTMLCGSHESRRTTRPFGFCNESLRNSRGPNVWKMCMEVFNCLGGRGPHLLRPQPTSSLDDLKARERRQEMPRTGAIGGRVDLLLEIRKRCFNP